MDDEITFELTTFEVASYYAVSESTVRRWCRSGYLPGAVKIWGRMSRGEVKKQPPDLTAGEFNRSE